MSSWDITPYLKQGMQILDIIAPEELLGVDITPGYGLGVQRGKERKIYRVRSEKGRLVDVETGRTIGYTPREAKKRYKTKRRAKRLTQKDRYEWEMRLAIAHVQAGKAAVPPVY